MINNKDPIIVRKIFISPPKDKWQEITAKDKKETKAILKECEKDIVDIRGRFAIPERGFRKIPKRIDKNKTEETKRFWRKRFSNRLVLLFSDKELKEVKIRRKSKRDKFQKAITGLRQKLDLPNRFQETLRDYVMFGVFQPFAYKSRCIVWQVKDEEEGRVFIEIFGDTKETDIRKAWKVIKDLKLQKKAKLKGRQLFRYKGYYINKEISHENKKKEGMSYNEINIRKYRQKKFEENR
ncbi:MAG: hypothetical protein K9L87_04655 [Candidatus Omnitrophica bacterium]|nr:hypothetical protein [Candidatus Omnitrophota bacterium]MCF7892524.1 hypothetical protein [Candidatus Omnitrophota bacterium]MCF7895681.1 hypothetical protein [Candidatus Omnitrophota bacterium]MCF7898021.1 hypothetical protein [Candidatus Omnitrophota bacterium]